MLDPFQQIITKQVFRQLIRSWIFFICKARKLSSDKTGNVYAFYILDLIHIRDCWTLLSTSSASKSSSDVTILCHRLIKSQLAVKAESCISDTLFTPSTIFLFCYTFSELRICGFTFRTTKSSATGRPHSSRIMSLPEKW